MRQEGQSCFCDEATLVSSVVYEHWFSLGMDSPPACSQRHASVTVMFLSSVFYHHFFKNDPPQSPRPSEDPQGSPTKMVLLSALGWPSMSPCGERHVRSRSPCHCHRCRLRVWGCCWWVFLGLSAPGTAWLQPRGEGEAHSHPTRVCFSGGSAK